MPENEGRQITRRAALVKSMKSVAVLLATFATSFGMEKASVAKAAQDLDVSVEAITHKGSQWWKLTASQGNEVLHTFFCSHGFKFHRATKEVEIILGDLLTELP